MTAGQGQSVTIAGVEVGLIGGVQLEHGQAVVTMDIFKRYAPDLPQRHGAAAAAHAAQGHVPGARSRNRRAPVSLPGRRHARDRAARSPTSTSTRSSSSLDADTRTYLLLLLAGGAQAFNGKGATASSPSATTAATLAADFKRFAPLDRSALNFTKLLSQRSSNLSHAIHNLNLVATSLGGVDTQLASLVKQSNTNFQAIASQDQALEQGISLLPGALEQTSSTLEKVQKFASVSGPALKQLEPFARDLGPALRGAAAAGEGHDPGDREPARAVRDRPRDPPARGRRSRRPPARWPRRRRRCPARSRC